MSGLRVNTLRGASTGTSPTFPDGVIVSGVTTSTSFSGNVTGNVTGNVVGNVTGNITGTTGTFTGNVSVGGTLTYEDVTNVDSVGVITARSGIRIGAGQSVSAVSGIVTYYGDGSKLTGVESGVGNFVATGAIPNGSTVVIKTDGTVGIVTGVSSPTSIGTPVVFESATSYYTTATYVGSGKVVIVYQDAGNSQYGTAVVGTVSGTSISFGTPVVFNASEVNYPNIAYDSNSNKVVICYQDNGNSNRGTAIVGTVSGTSISFGSETVFDSSTIYFPVPVFDSTNNKVVIAFRDGGSSNHGKAVVGTVSGTSISFGSDVTFESGTTNQISSTFDSTNGKVIIFYQDASDSDKGTLKVGTVSGTSISFGGDVLLPSSATVEYTSVTYDSANNKVVAVYRNNSSSKHGTAVVGTVGGTSISFGTPVVFEAAESNFLAAIYDSDGGQVVIAYSDNGNSNYGTVISGTVSGTSISFGTPVVFETGYAQYISATYDANSENVVIAYSDNPNSSYGTAVVLNPGGSSTNLTAENYIGIAAEAISNGATGKVNILGGVNSGQTGLTTAKTYYVQKTGSLATSADDPSVVAGTSISSTKILIR
jgi:hypothetical protein